MVKHYQVTVNALLSDVVLLLPRDTQRRSPLLRLKEEGVDMNSVQNKCSCPRKFFVPDLNMTSKLWDWRSSGKVILDDKELYAISIEMADYAFLLKVIRLWIWVVKHEESYRYLKVHSQGIDLNCTSASEHAPFNCFEIKVTRRKTQNYACFRTLENVTFLCTSATQGLGFRSRLPWTRWESYNIQSNVYWSDFHHVHRQQFIPQSFTMCHPSDSRKKTHVLHLT